MIIDEVYLQYVHMIIFIVVKIRQLLNNHKDCQEKLNNKLSWNNWNFLQKVSHSFLHVLKQQTMTVSKMFYDTHTGEVTDNKTWTASGNPGGLQTHAFCHN